MRPWVNLLEDLERAMSDVGWTSVAPLRRSRRRAVEAPPFWPEAVEAAAADAELEAVTHGGAVRILCLGPGAHEGPCFIRIGWGDLSVEPEIWAVLGGVAMEVTVGGTARVVPSFQVAGGASQLQLGVGLWLNERDYPSAAAVVERAVEAFDALCAGLHRTGQAGWGALVPGFDPFFADAHDRSTRQPFRGALPVGVSLLSFSVVGTVAAFLVNEGLGALMLTGVAPVAILGGVAALASHLNSKAPEGARALDRAIRACAVFDEHEASRALSPLRPVVILASGQPPYEFRMLGTATFRAGIFGASSTRHGLSLSASLQSLDAVGDIHPLCRVVPSSWVVVELEGPDAILERIGTRRSEQRQPEVLRVVFDEAALERGAFEELLAELTEIVELGAGEAGPYR